MRLHKEVAITLLFLALYTPLSIALWYKSGKVINLVFVFVIGLGMACLYIYAELLRFYIGKRRRRTYIQLREEPDEEEPEEDEDDDEEDYEEPEIIEPIPEYSGLEAFRALFSQTHGGETL